MSDIFRNNLDNIKLEIDLFGNRVEKLSMKDRIGFLPISIWQPDWSITNKLKDIVGDSGECRELREGSGNQRTTNLKVNTFGYQLFSSIFNPHLAQMILSAYCQPKAKIYDPFAGGGTRGFIATAMGHEYTGREIRQNEIDRILEQQKKLGVGFNIECGDAQDEPPKRDYFDFSYTCPPYYNLEIYSGLDNDLSNAPDYFQFLLGINKVMQSVWYSLKPGALSIWVVGNFRDKKGNLNHFNGDIANIGLRVGFYLHDEIIFWGAAGNAVQRCGQFEANRKSVRVHEYILIFRK